MNKQFCGNCGNRNLENLRFCENCGQNLESGDPNSIVGQPQVASETNFNKSNAHSGDIFGGIYEDEPTEKSSSTGNVIIGLCIFCSILLFGGLISAIVAFIVYLPFKKRENGWVFFLVTYLITAFIVTFAFKF